jgi:hypothetical protein
VLLSDGIQLSAQLLHQHSRKQRCAIRLTFSVPDDNLHRAKIDILGPQAHALEQSKP